uniref:C-type lectin domain-containing protein n=1 Tax=Chrysemys picta bellii TaxID=8478 RepID=A0A8C3P2E8_CHRPI
MLKGALSTWQLPLRDSLLFSVGPAGGGFFEPTPGPPRLLATAIPCGSVSICLHSSWEGASHPGRQSGASRARSGMLKRAVWLLLWRRGWGCTRVPRPWRGMGLEQGAGSQDSWVLFLALPDSLPGPELGYSGFCFLDSVCGHCPWGWAWFQRTCYYFSESTKIWREAKQFCLDYGAQLVIINTKEEQVFLVKNRPKSRAYWLGLSDKKVENQWLWVDGSPLKLSFWSSGEPNDSGDEDCGTMTLDGRWNDINCYMTDYWICEKPWLC